MTIRMPVVGVLFLSILMAGGCNPGTPSSRSNGIPPEEVTDYIYAVIEADRTTYTREVVYRLQDVEHVIQVNQHFKEEKALPLPSQMLRMGATLVSEKGKFRYALISPWAINKANLPKSNFEKKGLEAVVKEPNKPYKSYETAGGKKYFMALYPDKAVSPACIHCHNHHPDARRKDFKLGDVMGGIVIALPVS